MSYAQSVILCEEGKKMASKQNKTTKKKLTLKEWVAYGVILLLIFIFAPELLSSEQTSHEEGLIPVELVRVVDGDTIKIKYEGQERNVRYLLVDTPETVHPNKTTERFGPEASAFNKKLLENGQVSIRFDLSGYDSFNLKDHEDKYGRLLAYIYVDGKSVQEQLLAEGLARVAFIYPPKTEFVERYRAIEQQAKQQKKGIWSLDGYVTNRGFNSAKFPYEQK